jgi:hypothetical protein
MVSQEFKKYYFPSFRRKPESSYFHPALGGMDPGFAGVTTQAAYHEALNIFYPH